MKRLCSFIACLSLAALAACAPATAVAQHSGDLFVAVTEPITASFDLADVDATAQAGADLRLTETLRDGSPTLALIRHAAMDAHADASPSASPLRPIGRHRATPTPLAGPPGAPDYTGGEGAEVF